ncbi:MAG: response regulator transcription factor [Chloroflexi bacterium]|nr:response regulator transcription factor [Chloroflexota bacterium]
MAEATSHQPIRVLIADDHDLLRYGLATFMESCQDLELVGEAANGQEAVELCDRLKPDVVLMDLVMPEMDGQTATRIIRDKHPETQVIILTSFEDEERVYAAIQAGAISYLLKNLTMEAVASAIRAAYSGKSTLSQEATQALININHRPSPPDYQLTSREYEVLSLMVEGLSNVEIGQRMFISTSTVKKHIGNILAKLNTSSRTEAAVIAVRDGLVKK